MFGAFIGSAPIVGSNFNLPTGADASDPLDYSVTALSLGNGQGFFTERPGFGFPGGGSSDLRLQFYVGDAWKMKSNLTLTIGLRYVRDSGRTDSDLPPIPCSATTLFTCTGNFVDQFGAGLGGRVQQPNKNFAPQIGIAWDPQKNHKTVVRAGFSLAYENALFNNVLFDRNGRLSQGLFLVTQNVCPAGETCFARRRHHSPRCPATATTSPRRFAGSLSAALHPMPWSWKSIYRRRDALRGCAEQWRLHRQPRWRRFQPDADRLALAGLSFALFHGVQHRGVA